MPGRFIRNQLKRQNPGVVEQAAEFLRDESGASAGAVSIGVPTPAAAAAPVESLPSASLLPTPFYERNLFWGTATASMTIAVLGIGFGQNGHPIAAHWCFIASVPCAWISIWCACSTVPVIVRRWTRAITMLALTLAALFADFWSTAVPRRQAHSKPDHAVASALNGVYAKYSARLGKPLADSETGYAYQATHEHAVVIWSDEQKAFYQLPVDPARKWGKYPDPDYQRSPEWYRDEALRRRFKPPTNLGPPYAGVANHWVHDPKNWTWIGWREWHCYFTPGVVFVQSFEHGVVMGPFRLHPDNSAAQVFVLHESGSWESSTFNGDSPPCGVPPGQGETANNSPLPNASNYSSPPTAPPDAPPPPKSEEPNGKVGTSKYSAPAKQLPPETRVGTADDHGNTIPNIGGVTGAEANADSTPIGRNDNAGKQAADEKPAFVRREQGTVYAWRGNYASIHGDSGLWFGATSDAILEPGHSLAANERVEFDMMRGPRGVEAANVKVIPPQQGRGAVVAKSSKTSTPPPLDAPADPIPDKITITLPTKPKLSKYDFGWYSQRVGSDATELRVCLVDNHNHVEVCNTVYSHDIARYRNELRTSGVALDILDDAVKRMERGASKEELSYIANVLEAISVEFSKRAH
jgi:hypothetical protein